MTEIVIKEPTLARIIGLKESDRSTLVSAMKYRDLKKYYEYQRIIHSRRMLQALRESCLDEDEYHSRIQELRDSQHQTVLMDGDIVPAGLAPRVAELLGCSISNSVKYPEGRMFPWNEAPKNKPRPYQVEAIDRLIEARHGAIELATGLGKSTILLYLTKRLGLSSVIMCPSISIASQLYADFTQALGSKRVGLYGDGKKVCNRMVTIAIAASLAQVPVGSADWKTFQSKDLFAVDESHQTPATTLKHVCYGLMANAAYRLFVSATQLRGDGTGIVLEGITSTVVMRMSAREGIDAGWLARPRFKMLSVSGVVGDDGSLYSNRDVNRVQQHHIVKNPSVHKLAALLANKTYNALRASTLIIIDEIPQFASLLPHLQHKVAFAHSVKDKERLEKIPPAYRKSDVVSLVKAFNAGEFPVLVGTSAITTGTDFTTVGHIVDMMGGASETSVRQRVGRGTRRPPGKESFSYTDFDFANVPELHRHADARREIYADIYEDAQEIDMMSFR